MKKLLFTVIIFTLACQISEGQTKRYANAVYGNDSNDGSSWALAKKTLSGLDAIDTNNDTLIFRGDFGSEDWNMSADTLVCMDSLFYVNKAWKWLATPSNMDTTILDWGTTFDKILCGNSPYSQFWGINIDGQDSSEPYIDHGIANGNKFYFFRIKRRVHEITRIWELEGDDVVLKFVFIDGNFTGPVIEINQISDNYDIQYVTISMYSLSTDFVHIIDATTASPTGTIKNCLFQFNSDATASKYIAHDEPDESLSEADYNIYYGTNGDPANELGFEWDGGATTIAFTAWRDSLQTGVKGIDPDGENNSSNADPGLNENSDYASISNTSIARNASSDGINIGFYQLTIPERANDGRRRGLRRTTN